MNTTDTGEPIEVGASGKKIDGNLRQAVLDSFETSVRLRGVVDAGDTRQVAADRKELRLLLIQHALLCGFTLGSPVEFGTKLHVLSLLQELEKLLMTGDGIVLRYQQRANIVERLDDLRRSVIGERR